MLGAIPATPAEALRTRLIVEPRAPVRASVLPASDPERAASESLGAGIPADLLARFGASVRQTHRRAGVVVVEVPPERQDLPAHSRSPRISSLPC